MLPDTLFVKLKWTEIRHVPASILDKQEYELNGPFKPVSAVTTPNTFTQPLGWDEWGQFFNFYECFGSSIDILIVNRGATTPAGTVVVPMNDTGPTTDFIEAKVQPYATTRYTSGGNGKPFARIKKYMSVKKLEGRNTNDVNFTANINSLPTIQKFWLVMTESTNQSTDLDVFYDVTITYYIKFFGRPSIERS